MSASHIAEHFTPFDGLVTDLLSPMLAGFTDVAHDVSHLCRVWTLAARIAATNPCDREVLVAAVILHDCVTARKGSPMHSFASRLSADEARLRLRSRGWHRPRVDAVAHAVEAHSFSAAIEPRTIEAMILRDADRLDAMGAIGIARCFAIAGLEGRAMYDAEDPAARDRQLDDSIWALDHFAKKLLTLRDSLLTPEGRRIGGIKHDRLALFYAQFLDEVG